MTDVCQKSSAIIIRLLLIVVLTCVSSTGRELRGGDKATGFTGELSATAVDAKGAVWIGAKYGGIYQYQDQQLTLFDPFNTPIPDSGVSALFVDRDDVKWFGTTRGYVLTYDDKTWNVLPSERKLGGIAAIRQGPQGKMWIATKSKGIFQYENGKIELAFASSDARFQSLEAMDVDREGNLWVATRSGILRFDGQEWSKIDLEKPGNNAGGTLAYEKHTDSILCGNGTGLYRYEAAKWSLFANANSGMGSDHIRWIRSNGSGQIWVGHGDRQAGVSRFDGVQWKGFQPGRPDAADDEITDAAFGPDGRMWFPGRFHGLRMFDGDNWFTFPITRHRIDPRFWWRKKYLADLMKEETTDIELAEVMKDPFQYRGKKIRFVGRARSGFEYSELVDLNGQQFGIWPSGHPELGSFQRKHGFYKDLPKDQSFEFTGYLEFGGYYGHMGSFPHQFFMVEVYPLGGGPVKKEEVQPKLKAYIEQETPHLFLVAAPDTEDVVKARTSLAGTWSVVSAFARGKESIPTPNMTIVISEDKMVFNEDARESVGEFRIDPSRDLPAMDLFFFNGQTEREEQERQPTQSMKCIYHLDGDCLKICSSDEPERRPTQFLSEAEGKTELMILNRIGPAPEISGKADADEPGIVVPTRLE